MIMSREVSLTVLGPVPGDPDIAGKGAALGLISTKHTQLRVQSSSVQLGCEGHCGTPHEGAAQLDGRTPSHTLQKAVRF